MPIHQLPLQLNFYDTQVNKSEVHGTYREKLITLLRQDLDFHGQDSQYASHNFHPFPAKFPPQLPRKFIVALTDPGDVVLDPMLGSGTTIVEAFLTGRRGAGFDIDPLALLLSKVKVTQIDPVQVIQTGNKLLSQAAYALQRESHTLQQQLTSRWDTKTRQFIDYWFAPQTQIELLALITEIEKLSDLRLKAFFELVFSAIIITKSGGLSLALDLAHTRPHRAKVVVTQTGEVVFEHNATNISPDRLKILTKTLRSTLPEFEKRLQHNLKGELAAPLGEIQPDVTFGDAQKMPLSNDSVDLIVTSPPYASNAIDYMRAHKFSLVWMRHSIDYLGQKRKKYIGGEAITNIDYKELPDVTVGVVAEVGRRNEKKGRILHRYYSEMTLTLQEMFRVLKPGKAAVVVVGTSVMSGVDTQTQACLADIGQAIGFETPEIGVRNLDRNRRMLPVGNNINLNSQIQQRMHEEYVIGFYKPEV